MEHGTRIPEDATYFNAGCMVLAPNRPFFEILRDDVQKEDPEWHYAARCPEQAFLSWVLAGEFTHISQEYNLEVTPHGGSPLTDLWQQLAVEKVRIVHFSGAPKVWELKRGQEVFDSVFTERNFESLPPPVAKFALRRREALHQVWFKQFEETLRYCQARLLPWNVPHEVLSELPSNFAAWVRSPPPLDWERPSEDQLRLVLRRLPRPSFAPCRRVGCPMACTWSAPYCCWYCRADDQLEARSITHGRRCDQLPLHDRGADWKRPPEELGPLVRKDLSGRDACRGESAFPGDGSPAKSRHVPLVAQEHAPCAV